MIILKYLQIHIFFFKCPVSDNQQHRYWIRAPDDIKQPVLRSRCSSFLPLQSTNVQDYVLICFSELGQQDSMCFRDMILKFFRIFAELWRIYNLLVLHIQLNLLLVLRRPGCGWRKRCNYEVQVKCICTSHMGVSFERNLRSKLKI